MKVTKRCLNSVIGIMWVLGCQSRLDGVRSLGRVPLVIAYGGASAEHDSHSAAALTKAIQDGADFIALRVYFTKDRVPVVSESDTLDNSQTISNSNLSAIQSPPIFAFRKGQPNAKMDKQKVLTLQNAIDIVKAKSVDALRQVGVYLVVDPGLDAQGRMGDAAFAIASILLMNNFLEPDDQLYVQCASITCRRALSDAGVSKFAVIQSQAVTLGQNSETMASIGDVLPKLWIEQQQLANENAKTNRMPFFLQVNDRRSSTLDEKKELDGLVALWRQGIDGMMTRRPDVAVKTRNQVYQEQK